MRHDATFRASQDVIARAVGEELVLLDYGREVYYGLDPIGARIWELLSPGATFESIVDTLLEEHEVDRDQLEGDVMKLITELETAGLVRIED